uniref:Glutathione S-transferase n=1 Tax=Mus spicilegus TaxID=10103 RepID=A0A8C6HK03_MUSSI
DQCFCSPAPSLLAAQCFCDGLCPSSPIQCTLWPWRASHGRHTECQALCLLSPRERIQVPHIPSDPPCLSIQLPYLIDGSHKITQSNAILRYLARKHHLGEWGWPQGGGWGIISSAWQGWDAECTVCAAGGETEEERIRADIVENQVMDTRMQLIMLCYNPDFEKQKPEFLKTVPEKMKLYSEFLGKRPWFAGDKVKGRVGRRSCHPPLVSDSRALNLGFLQVTYVDFLAYDILDQYRMFEPKCLDAFPNLRDFLARFEGLKKISAYMKSSRYIATPVFSKMAHWSNK